MSNEKTVADFKSLPPHEMAVIYEALLWCAQMLQARDEMNSKVHCAPVRYSPITERVIRAMALITWDMKNEI